jgi:hypothetical protein
MKVEDLRAELTHRLSLDVNDDYGIEESWKSLTKILSENVDDTICFFNNECTDEEFFWLSEVFSDVSEVLQSKEFVQTLRNRLARVTPDKYDQKAFHDEHIRMYVDYEEYVRSTLLDIDYAEGALND